VWSAVQSLVMLAIDIVRGLRFHSVHAVLPTRCGGIARAIWTTDDPLEPVRMAALLRVHAARAKTMSELCAAMTPAPTAVVSSCEGVACDCARRG
jgi:hypothetical protein